MHPAVDRRPADSALLQLNHPSQMGGEPTLSWHQTSASPSGSGLLLYADIRSMGIYGIGVLWIISELSEALSQCGLAIAAPSLRIVLS